MGRARVGARVDASRELVLAAPQVLGAWTSLICRALRRWTIRLIDDLDVFLCFDVEVRLTSGTIVLLVE